VNQQHPASERTFLFLQGPSSPIFALIADGLEASGARCWRINLNVGDWIFWRRKGGVNYRGRFENWRGYVRQFLAEKKVTDVIVLGEERPYHKVAIEEARKLGALIYVVEMGYLRPDWVTIERDGMSSNSHFPRDPAQILEAARGMPEPDWAPRYTQSFFAEAALDLIYNLPNVFLGFLFPHYCRHALYHPLAEYAGWLKRLSQGRRRSKEAHEVIDRLIRSGKPFFVYPLQLETDYQLRAHSPFGSQREAIQLILQSFARAARPEARLLVKAHPLDNGLTNWFAVVNDIATRMGISQRVSVIDGGNLEEAVASGQGVVTVNSTAALSALRVGKPVAAVGSAIYRVEGLCAGSDLDGFWATPIPPKRELAHAFFRLLASSIQVRGNFYSIAGSQAAAEAITAKLLGDAKNGANW
jgi:capsular polysaccharide export protein